MRISLAWLKDYIGLDVAVDQLVHDLTMLGLEIEAVHRPGDEITQVKIGRILSIEPHPEADKIVVCKTDVGEGEPLQICCGAKNMKVGDKVPTAVVGATLPGGFSIGRRKMRGVESSGMMCSARELGLGENHEGLLILPEEGFPVGADAKPLLGLDDVILEIEVTPNRGDWASYLGVARELSAHYRTPWRRPDVSLTEIDAESVSFSSVSVESPDLCPRYLGRVCLDVKVGPSPDWLARRVAAAGMRSINNVVDITNYVLLETGQPLHAFDLDKLAGNGIVVRRARPGESIRTLDGEVRALAEDMLVIADAERPQCVAGIMGGAESEVTAGTTRIFLESAWFLPASVRKTSRALNLASESSQRFQRGADPAMAAFALDRAAALLAQVAGAHIARGALDHYPNPLPVAETTLRHARVAALLGVDIPADAQRGHLTRLGFEVIESGGEATRFRAPTWRPDIHGEADLIEEIARLHGFDNIPARLPRLPQVQATLAPEERLVRRLRRFLVDQGLTETMHWTFTNEEDVRKAGLPADAHPMVRLQNPLSERHATMRPSLVPAMLNCLRHNINHGRRSAALFEIGPVYRPAAPGADHPVTQYPRLAVALTGAADAAHWSRPERPADFYDLKGMAEAALEHFGLTAGFSALECDTYQPGQSADIAVGGTPVGRLGKVSHTVLDNFGIGQEVFLLEVDLEPLWALLPEPAQFTDLPEFPASLRDLAVVVDRSKPAGSLLETAREAGGKLLAEAFIFDIYTGKPIPEDKKSVALGLSFQSPERTLTDKDTEKAVQRILRQLERDHGAVLR